MNQADRRSHGQDAAVVGLLVLAAELKSMPEPLLVILSQAVGLPLYQAVLPGACAISHSQRKNQALRQLLLDISEN